MDDLATIPQLYRDRADVENTFDELRNQRGWCGFTTHDLQRSALMARLITLIYNWWNLFIRLVDPTRHLEAITSRPLLLYAVGKQSRYTRQLYLSIHNLQTHFQPVRDRLSSLSVIFQSLHSTAPQLSPLERWYAILSRVLVKYLKGRILKITSVAIS